MKRENIDPKYTKVEHSVKAIGHLLHSFEADYGREELVKFMDRTGVPLKYFNNNNNWVSYEYLLKLLDQIVEYTNDPNIMYRYGLNTVKYSDTWGVLKTIFTLISAPSFLYKSVVKFHSRFAKQCIFKINQTKKNRVEIELIYKNSYNQTRNNCLNIQGSLASLPTYFGLPIAEIKELQCAAQGAKSCVYEITWQREQAKKNNFFSLLIGIFTVYIIYFVVHCFYQNDAFLSKIILFLFPVALYIAGRALDYKRTIKDNTEVTDDQNKAIVESLENVQKLNEELQLKIDQRTEELKISNRKLEETLIQVKKSEEDLLAAEKMAGIGRLAAGVAHEINNPIGAVRNYIQDILEDISANDLRRDALLEAEKATDESKILINQLLSFSRSYENLYIVDIDINEVLERICEKIKFSNFSIKINKSLTDGLPVIKSDKMQIDQVFSNIILNACKTIKEDGIISVKTSSSFEGIYVEITNNVESIPDYLINNLFDPARWNNESTGRKDLELAISYSIVKRFNGEMTVSSTFENGTIFKVLIPYDIKV
jgi:signal transduction histidine kinase